MLKIENLTKLYSNQRGLNDCSINIKPGEIVGVIGANGSGKTTLFKIILGLKKEDSGSITFNKEEIRQIPQKQFGYLPEERSIYQDIKVFQQIEHIASLKGMAKTEIANSLNNWLERLDIRCYKDNLIKELSKGNQQKVQLICALIHNPDILILDEPLTGLDVLNAKLFKEIIFEEAKKKKTILISSHQFEHVEGLFNKVLILDKGKTIYAGDVDKLKKKSKERYISFISSKHSDYFMLDGVIHQSVLGKEVRLLIENEEKAKLILEQLLQDENITSLTIELPTLKDIIQERGLND